MRRAVAPAATAVAVALAWLAWEGTGLLRGTWASDLRLVIWAALAIGLLSLAEAVSARIRSRSGKG